MQGTSEEVTAPAFVLPSPEQLASGIAKLTPDKQKKLNQALRVLKDAGRPLPDTHYQTKPVEWAVSVLGIPENSIRWSLNEGYESHNWDGTPDPLASTLEAIARGDKLIGVESATGTGKTYTNAIAALWFLACFEDAIVVTTAPKEKQLKRQLWKEIGRHWPKFKKAYPKATKLDLTVRLKEGSEDVETWAISGWGCGVGAVEESATKAQGFHSAHMLIITEETPGIDNAVMAAFKNTSVGSHNIILAVGNPDHQLDTLHQFCTRKGATHIRISAYDHPNVVLGQEIIPGATTQSGIDGLADDWGIGSGMFESRARGISPPEAVNALIKMEWLKAAADRWRTASRSGVIALGVDVANSIAGDKAAIAKFNGSVLEEVTAKTCPDSNKLGDEVFALMELEKISPENVGVDGVGVGAGTVNTLRDKTKGYEVGLMGGGSPIANTAKGEDGKSYAWVPDSNRFQNLRGQMYWQLREDLRQGRIALPNDPQLFRELVMPTFEIRGNVVVVESKETIKERMGGKSPDKADAVVYGNWVRYRGESPSQDVQEAYEGRDRTVFEPLDQDFEYGTGSGTLSQIGSGW